MDGVREVDTRFGLPTHTTPPTMGLPSHVIQHAAHTPQSHATAHNSYASNPPLHRAHDHAHPAVQTQPPLRHSHSHRIPAPRYELVYKRAKRWPRFGEKGHDLGSRLPSADFRQDYMDTFLSTPPPAAYRPQTHDPYPQPYSDEIFHSSEAVPSGYADDPIEGIYDRGVNQNHADGSFAANGGHTQGYVNSSYVAGGPHQAAPHEPSGPIDGNFSGSSWFSGFKDGHHGVYNGRGLSGVAPPMHHYASTPDLSAHLAAHAFGAEPEVAYVKAFHTNGSPGQGRSCREVSQSQNPSGARGANALMYLPYADGHG